MSDKAKFWIRFSIWAILACVLPVVFIAWRFELFAGKKISLSGFGVLAIIIAAVFFLSLLKYVRKGMPYSMFSQCVSGFCKITLPLFAFLGILWCARNSIDDFLKVLGFVLVSETIAIPVNPMPAWLNKNIKEEDQKRFDSMSDVLLDKFFSRKEDKK